MKNIRHTGIYVKDLKKMRSFYKDIMEMQEVFYGEEKGAYIEQILRLDSATVQVCKLIFPDGGMIELLQTSEEQNETPMVPVWRQGKYHIAITVESVDYEYQRLKQLGIFFLSEPCISPDNNAKVCFCRDVEGNYLELVEELKRRNDNDEK